MKKYYNFLHYVYMLRKDVEGGSVHDVVVRIKDGLRVFGSNIDIDAMETEASVLAGKVDAYIWEEAAAAMMVAQVDRLWAAGLDGKIELGYLVTLWAYAWRLNYAGLE